MFFKIIINSKKREIQGKKSVAGEYGLGKSALTLQFTQNYFVEEYDPTIEDSYLKHMEIKGENCFFEIYEMVGGEEEPLVRPRAARRADGVLVLYSITSRNSFDLVTVCCEQIRKYKDSDHCPIMIVATKADLEDDRKVSQGEGMDLAKSLNCSFIETSAKSNLNVEQAFIVLARKINKSRLDKLNNNLNNRKPTKITKTKVHVKYYKLIHFYEHALSIVYLV
ncbi:ras gtpase-related [Anaeramoeba flamelloides]|uniref:Ras gtpase-related n=1 Tax=Anaeramoeba flamelloides TaxID=1746091 RepID=A0AAV7YFN6_9EUKA|nr:ras gtpase-related [Anaeramoeba flamelloides]